MKRHPALIPLSRDHHNGLEVPPEELANAVRTRWEASVEAQSEPGADALE